MSSPSPSSTPPHGRILVVDDEPSVGTALRRVVGQEHQVTVVTSGRVALDLLLHEEPFDMVLCDLMLPDLTGMDLYEQLQQARPGMESRLAFMTGGAFTARGREFLNRVTNPTLEKPFDMHTVRDLVGHMLSHEPPA